MTFEVFKWTTALASLVGVVLNIHRRKSCFAIWACTNSSWVAIDLYHGVWAQAALQTVYVGLSFYGLWQWRHGR
jgi:hypothetical protein